MKHIESSKLINLPADTDVAAIKHSFVERLRGPFHIETVGESNEHFSITATGRYVPCSCTLNVLLRTDKNRARIVVDGNTGITAGTKILYVLGFLALLVLGLFPGTTINTSGRGSAMDFMVFLFLGAFILYDLAKKQAEPEILIDRILSSVEAEYST